MTEDLAKYEARQTVTVEPKELTPQGSFFATIERLAANPAVNTEKINQIMAMYECVLDRNAKQAFSSAMVQVQINIPTVPRDKTNKGTTPPSKYSSYEMIMKHCKPVYTSAGFAISTYEGAQIKEGENYPAIKEGEVRVFGDIMHEGGWSKTYYTDVPLDDKGPQGTKNKTLPHAKKSSLSYGRSTLMCMILNIPTGDDDDGNAAGKGTPDMITKDQKKRIEKLVEMLGISDADFEKRLSDRFEGIKKVDELYTESADTLTKTLEKMVKERQ